MEKIILRIQVIKKLVNGVEVFSGWVEGKKVRDVAKIVHITREGKYIHGYQRSELPKHIESIKDYVESPKSAILANLVIGFNKSVTFTPLEEGSEFGHLEVPYYPEGPSMELPGAIVDGQQRSGGIKNSFHESYPLPVSIFISEDENDYIQQFLILNLGKPLTSVQLNALALNDNIYKPPALAVKAFPLSISEELGFGDNSNGRPPLKGLIKSNGNPQGKIAESSITEFVSNVERMILKSINIRVHQELTKESKKLFVQIINNFWIAITDVFKHEWENISKSMKDTYIIHGTSIFGFSFLCRHMIRVFLEDKPKGEVHIPSIEFFMQELKLIAHKCHFSKTSWNLGLIKSDEEGGEDIKFSRRWHDFQNTTSEKQLFAGNLLKIYEVEKGFKTDHDVYFS
ncbi:DGQHR domain-containing protein [Thalassotalea crassostreae]|uniref:DGQHR domain-containing protein n=1 Tax=Thalassotalea crassostreae TaxID=1763536 RepID=UPI0008391151|nr:DGQHR domain-containing protein [Thalassotalea crassostreae]